MGAMEFAFSDMYPGMSLLTTRQTTIPEDDDKQAIDTDTETAGGVKEASATNATAMQIGIFIIALLVVAGLLGAM